MTFTSTIADMLINPNHKMFAEVHRTSDQPLYILKDNTIYYLIGVWSWSFREYLESNGVVIPEDRRMYTPIAKLTEGKYIGYNTQNANIGNKLLDICDSLRDKHYPNLYFVEVGNHPYPKEARYHHNWMIDNYHRECNVILNPPSDPKDFFLHPNSLNDT